MVWDNDRLLSGFPFTFTCVSDGGHLLSSGTLRHCSISMDITVEQDSSGLTEQATCLAEIDPFLLDNPTVETSALPTLGSDVFIQWSVTYTDDGDMTATCDIVDSGGTHLNGYSIRPFTIADGGGLTASWDGVINHSAWDPAPTYNTDPLAAHEYSYYYFEGGAQSTWFGAWNLEVPDEVIPADPDEPEVIEEDNKLSVWGFNQDGHKHYVLRLGDGITLVYDRTTGQWAEWRTEGETIWRPHLGLNWLGIGAGPLGTHSWNVIGGDDRSGILWNIDPSHGLDHDATQTEVPFTRKVIGMYPQRIREGTQCGGIYVIGDLGDPAVTGDTITLQTSDDNGQSWTNHGTVTVTAADYTQEIAWIGLGLITNPGRLFLLEDDGAFARISSMDMR